MHSGEQKRKDWVSGCHTCLACSTPGLVGMGKRKGSLYFKPPYFGLILLGDAHLPPEGEPCIHSTVTAVTVTAGSASTRGVTFLAFPEGLVFWNLKDIDAERTGP